MKKYTINIFKSLVILVLILWNTSFVVAAQICPIEETPEYIKEYLINVHKVVSNVNALVSERYTPPEQTTKKSSLQIKTIKNIQGSLNRLFTWKWFELDYEYSTQENSWEIPKQLKRDINLLKNEATNLRLAKPEWAEIEVTWAEICKWVENCDFNPITHYEALKVIEKLKISTDTLKYILKNQATDYNFTDNSKVYLINPYQLLEEYSKENIKKCNLSETDSWEKWFFLTIVNRVKNIDLLNDHSRDGMADWKEAIDLLRSKSESSEYKQKEREVLARELEKQWIGWDSASVIMSNLDAYNNSEDGEFPFLWWEQWFFNSLKIQIDEFEETLEKKFPWYKSWEPTSNIVSVKNISNEITKLKEIKRTEIDINSQYNKLKSLALTEDTSNDIFINRMIDAHLSISEMINSLNKTCKISLKVCNSQKKWEWDCGECY